jgi:hypothetical protein
VTQIYERFKDRAEFVTIYIKEAHPTDECKPGPFGYDPGEVEAWLLAHQDSKR